MFSPSSSNFGPDRAKFRPISESALPIATKFGRSRSNFVDFGRNQNKLDQRVLDFGQTWATLSNLDGFDPNFCHFI